jgi:hypothetical protein
MGAGIWIPEGFPHEFGVDRDFEAGRCTPLRSISPPLYSPQARKSHTTKRYVISGLVVNTELDSRLGSQSLLNLWETRSEPASVAFRRSAGPVRRPVHRPVRRSLVSEGGNSMSVDGNSEREGGEPRPTMTHRAQRNGSFPLTPALSLGELNMSHNFPAGRRR